MRRVACALAVVVCAALLSPPAVAAPEQERRVRSVESRVVVAGDRLDMVELRYDLWGRVASRVKTCTKARTLHLFTIEDGRRVKTARSNRQGAWRFVLRPSDLPDPSIQPAFRVSLARKVVRVDGRRVVCRPGTMRAARSEVEIGTYDTSLPPSVVATGDVRTYVVDRCAAARRVSFRNLTTRRTLGSDLTDATGQWRVPFDPEATGSTDSHTYRATAVRQVVSWNGKRVTCLSASDTEKPGEDPARRPRSGSWLR